MVQDAENHLIKSEDDVSLFLQLILQNGKKIDAQLFSLAISRY